MKQETLIASNTFLKQKDDNFDQKSNLESLTRDQTSIVFSED